MRIISHYGILKRMKNMAYQDQTQIILESTSHPGNIGASARAIKTMGLTNLALVNPKKFPDFAASARASGAEDVLDNAEIYSSITAAAADCHTLFATSSRARSLETRRITPSEAGALIAKLHSEKQKVAIIFGNEQHGLSNEDLLRCQYQIVIPTSEVYSSLNLASAVQIICYELFVHASNNSYLAAPLEEPATAEQQAYLSEHLITTLHNIGYIKEHVNSHIKQKLQATLNKIPFSAKQVQIIRGVLTHIDKMSKK